MKSIILIILVLTVFVSACTNTVGPGIDDTLPTPGQACAMYDTASWSEEFKECTGVSQGQCDAMGGNFNECASACRNDKSMQVCTDQCVQVCEFSTNSGTGKLQAYDCTDPRPTACTKEYMPVCGQVQIQCITEPCDIVKETFGNKCEACANSLTISYTQGACQDNSAGGTVLAGSSDFGCADMGGTYNDEFKECTGINSEQCQEIGGTFNECASACRNNPDAQMCTLQCVQVCEFE